MLSSQDEACKFLVRSEMISYHSVKGNSFFFSNNFARRRAGKVLLLRRLYTTFHKKAVFFFGENFGYVNVACNFGNFGLVWPCFVILGMIMIDVAYLSVIFSLSQLKYCFWYLQGKF